jgi:hypothetical protein
VHLPIERLQRSEIIGSEIADPGQPIASADAGRAAMQAEVETALVRYLRARFGFSAPRNLEST